jgi:hypothetical protein
MREGTPTVRYASRQRGQREERGRTFIMATWPVLSGTQNAGAPPPDETSCTEVSTPWGPTVKDCKPPVGSFSFVALVAYAISTCTAPRSQERCALEYALVRRVANDPTRVGTRRTGVEQRERVRVRVEEVGRDEVGVPAREDREVDHCRCAIAGLPREGYGCCREGPTLYIPARACRRRRLERDSNTPPNCRLRFARASWWRRRGSARPKAAHVRDGGSRTRRK